jgi:hypothetical protein
MGLEKPLFQVMALFCFLKFLSQRHIFVVFLQHFERQEVRDKRGRVRHVAKATLYG